MPSRLKYALLISLVVVSLIVVSFNTSYADTTNYIYDELNRLKRVEYQDGTIIEYIYDSAGNRLYVGAEDIVPPVTTATPAGGTYGTAQSVTLTCSDGTGSGCDKIYYTTDGNDPTTSSPVYSSPINISVTTTLKFFAKDLAGNSEAVESETYYIDLESISVPSNPDGPINGNGGTSYTYSTGGAVSTYGHSLQYLFDWGDGTNSGWLPVGQTSASHSWSSQGNYLIKAQARCSIHPSVVSNWSGTTSVSIVIPTGNDSYTKSLLHMNGPDGSTTFIDDAAGGTHTWTASGNAQIDTAQSKFGGASGLFDGNGDYLSTPDSSDFAFGTGNFTIDFWVKFNVTNTYQMLYSQRVNSQDCIDFLYYGATDGHISFYAISGGVYKASYATPAWAPGSNWHHIAIVRNGSNFYIFIDGISQSLTVYTAIDGNTMPDVAAELRLGNTGGSGSYYYLNGWLDEYRISKGIARWTANFTPPANEY